jgi:hypothetical protein
VSVPFKNVTVSVAPIQQAKLANSTLDNPALGAASSGVQAYLETLSPREFFEAYNVRLESPAIIQVEVSDASKFPPDAQVEITASVGVGVLIGTKWRVIGRPDVHDDGLMADHALFWLDQRTYPFKSY